MFMETPQTLIFITGGAFLLGWLVGKIGAYFGNKIATKKRDPRDDRIRSLEAELRIARGEDVKAKAESEEKQKEIVELQKDFVNVEGKLDIELGTTQTLRKDLHDSVRKTHELRAELTDRATENIKSEVKLREVQTELSVARASTDMISTGVLDYSLAPNAEDEKDEKDEEDAAHIIKSNF